MEINLLRHFRYMLLFISLNMFKNAQNVLKKRYFPCRSSTVLKRIPYSKRHQDMFGGSENNGTNQRGVILHTDRYAKVCSVYAVPLLVTELHLSQFASPWARSSCFN